MGSRGTELDILDEGGYGSQAAGGVSLAHWAGFAIGAVWRRKGVAAALFLLAFAASYAFYYTRTPVYRVEAKVLAQRPQALPAAVRPVFDDAPARSAWELIHRRENLIALVRQTNLLGDPGGTNASPRAGLREWLTRATAKGKGSGTAEKDPLNELVLVLDKRLVVQVEEGTILIQLDWPDPQEAYALVQGALQNFLEARHLQEITAIEEVISVMRGRVALLRKEFDDITEGVRKHPTRASRPNVPRTRPPSQELVRVQSTLDAKRRAIQDVEEFRQRRLADLHAQLDQARNTLSDAHPTVVGLRQQIEALGKDSPQVEALRSEERKLSKDYAERAAREGATGPSSTPPALEVTSAPEEDQRVREARIQYEQMNARLGSAEVERDAARAAFKYRYNVIWPPQVPTEPYGPNPFKILGAGLFLSLALAVATAVAPDIVRGRVVERWQVEKVLDLPVLAETNRDR